MLLRDKAAGALATTLRMVAAAFVIAVLFVDFAPTALAGTTGVISGTVVDQAKHPVKGVKVTATAPTGKNNSVTDANGFYSMTGVVPDTYAVSFVAQSYETAIVSGVTVSADTTAVVNQTLAPIARTIGTVNVRATSNNAFQPKQTTDTYTVNSTQVDTLLGKSNAVSETTLLVSLPGATLDSSGYPVIRGGRENEEGFQVEGINYVDPFSNQFINTLALNGVSQVQLTPGAGDISVTNAGTGVINIVIKRGRYPAFGSLDLEADMYPFHHQLGLEYGFATPDNRLSDYVSFTGSRQNYWYNSRNADAATIARFYSLSALEGNDLVNNLVFRFGPNQNQQVQFFYQNQDFKFTSNNGGINGLFYKTNDPESLLDVGAVFGLPTSWYKNYMPLYPGQTSVNQPLGLREEQYQPNESWKLEYTKNIDAASFLSLRVFKTASVLYAPIPFNGQGQFGTGDFIFSQGGYRSAVGGDYTKQLNSKNLAKLGFQYEYQKSDDYVYSASLGFFALAGFGNSFEIVDFQKPSFLCFLQSGGVPCGYLWTNPQAIAAFGPNGPPRTLPFFQRVITPQQNFSVYVDDKFSPNDRVKSELGLKYEGVNTRFPISGVPREDQYPRVLSPTAAVAYQFNTNDSIRLGFARSVLFAPLADIDASVANIYQGFNSIPSRDPLTGVPATFCGINANMTCANYGEQLYWENQTTNGKQFQPVKPETFTNWELSYNHLFKHNVGMKITPFYRRGYDALVLTSAPRTDSKGNVLTDPSGNILYNPPQSSNLGSSKTTGVEFYLTQERPLGLSTILSMTYINELSNVIPLSPNEDFFPTIPPASLALGNLYRVGFLSPFQANLALTYKTASGWRFNPIISYNKGYPIGQGNLTSTFINGVPYNLPNTNITNPGGANQAPNYVDPANPGTLTNPVLVGSRGTPEAPSAGGVLSSARFNTDATIEFSPPKGRSTYGVLVTNIFNNIYGQPGYNSRYQPVATGIAGPNTGLSTNPINFPGTGYAQWGSARHGQEPYTIIPNEVPTTVRFYYQLGF